MNTGKNDKFHSELQENQIFLFGIVRTLEFEIKRTLEIQKNFPKCH